MIQDPTEPPQAPADSVTEPGSATGALRDIPASVQVSGDLDPDTATVEDEEDGALPDITDDSGEPVPEGPLAIGRAAIEHAVKHAPTSPGVYRMLNAASDVLYVGKAKNVKKRLASYARPTGHVMRIARMIAATVVVEIISTSTETEALLLEANLIKQLRPRFNVLLRDDKSFPY
ncbi:MAG: Excinuclease subunit, partial [Tardiphaga sp.]|nr:Excinuclease subunit [Tardiphaga sp.]